LRATSDLRLRDDLDERHAGAIEIDACGRHTLATLRMKRFSSVLFKMDPHKPDPLPAAPGADLDTAADAERPIVLGDLVALGEIRIEVVLSGEDAPFRDRGADRETGHDRETDRPLVQHGKHPRKSEAHRTDLGIGSCSERSAAPAEYLRPRLELRVDFEAHDRLVVVVGGFRHRARLRLRPRCAHRSACVAGTSAFIARARPGTGAPGPRPRSRTPTHARCGAASPPRRGAPRAEDRSAAWPAWNPPERTLRARRP